MLSLRTHVIKLTHKSQPPISQHTRTLFKNGPSKQTQTDFIVLALHCVSILVKFGREKGIFRVIEIFGFWQAGGGELDGNIASLVISDGETLFPLLSFISDRIALAKLVSPRPGRKNSFLVRGRERHTMGEGAPEMRNRNCKQRERERERGEERERERERRGERDAGERRGRGQRTHHSSKQQ